MKSDYEIHDSILCAFWNSTVTKLLLRHTRVSRQYSTITQTYSLKKGRTKLVDQSEFLKHMTKYSWTFFFISENEKLRRSIFN